MFEIGRACVKIAGHEAGRNCTVIDSVDDNFVIIAGPGIKKRRCNIKHLEPLPHKLNLKKGASELEAINALIEAGLAEKQKEYPKKVKAEVKVEPEAPSSTPSRNESPDVKPSISRGDSSRQPPTPKEKAEEKPAEKPKKGFFPSLRKKPKEKEKKAKQVKKKQKKK